MKSTLLTATLCAVFAMISTPSMLHAQDASGVEFDELKDKARQAFVDGNYAKAITLMELVFEKEPRQVYLVNIASAYAKLGDCAKATEAQQKATAFEPGDVSEETLTSLDDIVKEACKPKAEEKKPDPIEEKGEGGIGNNEGDGKVQPPPESSNTLLYTSVGLSVLGLAAISTAFFAIESPLSDDLDALEAERANPGADHNARVDQLQKDIDDASPLLIGLYAGGGILLVGGVTLLALELMDSEEDPRPATGLRVAPIIGPDSWGVAIGAPW